jgi:hypothetical protein
MDKNRLKNIIQNPNDFSNKDLIESLDFLNQEHENLKNDLISKTYFLDEIKKSYELLLEVYKHRIKK